MKRKLFVVFTAAALSIALVFSLTGCAIRSTKGPSGPGTTVDENKEASIHLTVGTLKDTSEQALMTKWINAFQKLHKEVGIKISKTYTAMENLMNWKGKDEMPDIVWTAGDQHATFSHDGYFRDLSNETQFAGSAQFFSGFYDEIVATTHRTGADTGIWFVPRDYNRITIFYNKTVFESMNIPFPQDGWTWEQFENTCQLLMTETNGYRCTKAIEWRDWEPIYSTMMRNYGSEYINSNGKVALRSTNTENLYNWFKNTLVSRYAIVGEGTAFKSYSNRAGSGNAKTPPVAMFTDTYAKLGTLAAAATRLNWNIDAVSFPAYTAADNGKGYVGTGCSGYAITTDCTEEEKIRWSWEFLKYCMSENGYNEVADLGVVCPALKSMRNDGAWTRFETSGTAVNYRAFVDDSTDDAGLNYFNAIKTGSDIGWRQGQLQSHAKNFWKKMLNGDSYSAAVTDFVNNCAGSGINE